MLKKDESLRRNPAGEVNSHGRNGIYPRVHGG
jgi:hypothetical protein